MRLALRTAMSVALAMLVIGAFSAPAQAARRLSVSKTKGLDRGGESVTVSGRGYDVTKGIYVAFCVDNGPGALPSPCGGGADMSGSSGTSAWISSNPPSYGEGLATPYGKGGSFRVSIRVSRTIGDVDCVVRACAIVTRADHTRTSDRSQDVRVPLRFGTGAEPATAATGRQAPQAKGSKPAGPPTGRLATAAPPGAVTSETPPAAAIALNRTTTATPLGHWWAIGGAFLTGVIGTVLIGRLRRRKQTTA